MNKNDKTKSETTDFSTMTLNEILETDNIQEIKNAIQDFVYSPSEKHFWQNIYPEYAKINELYEQALPLRDSRQKNTDNNLANTKPKKTITKFTIPKFAEQIDEIVDMIVNSLLSKIGKYWDSHKLSNNDEDKKLIQIFDSLLLTELYNFNCIRLIETLRIRDAVLYGIGWKKEYWKKKISKVRKIDVVNTTQKLDKDGKPELNAAGQEIFEYEENVKIENEIIADNLAVDYVDFRNMRIYYADTNITELFELHEHKYISLDDCLEAYSNFKQYKSKYIKYMSSGAEVSKEDYDLKRRGNTTSSNMHKQNTSVHIVEMYINNTYHFTLLIEGDDENSKIIDILIPKNYENRADKFLIKENHSRPCYTPFVYAPRSDSAYADGKACRLVGQQILADYFLNLSVSGAMKKIFSPYIFNPEFVDEVSVANAVLGLGQMIRITERHKADDAIDKIFQQVRIDYNVPELFNFANFFYAKNEELSKISNSQSAPSDNAFIKTLGGLQLQMQKLSRSINSSVSLNSYFEQQFLFRCFLDILQYLPRQFAIQITGTSEYVIIENQYNNQIRNVNDLLKLEENENLKQYRQNRPKKNGKEVYLIDELLKLNIELLTISFGSISDEIRLNELSNILAIANPMFASGLISKEEISVILNEIFMLLNSNIKVKSNTSEMEKIEQENEIFNRAFNKFYPMFKSNVISADIFNKIMTNATPTVNDDDLDELHLKHNSPALLETEHGQLHLQRIQQKQAAQEQLNQIANNQMTQNIPNMSVANRANIAGAGNQPQKINQQNTGAANV